MNIVSKYASLVKFSHTIFAMPFALIAYTWALVSSGDGFEWSVLVEVLLCMLFARNAAMAFNRWTDSDIDAQNPRTAAREIPKGVITKRNALLFVIVNIALFISTTALINNLALYLSPVALIVLLGYSYTKRFTALSHIVLGVALGIAPIGAYIAVCGTIGIVPILLSGLVITWVAGFDIIYSLQDREFDRANNLHSIASRFSVRGAIAISIILHLISIYALFIIGIYSGAGVLYWIGAAIFTTLTTYQHIIVTPKKLDRIGAMFGLVNGATSLIYGLFTIADMVYRLG